PAPAPVGPEAPSTKIVHLSAPSFEEARAVISATKSAKTCAFEGFSALIADVELEEFEGPFEHPARHVWSSKQ
ncbi:hypothetical protein A2U01_0080581, partial [Trifolium medium]|nr:hypothetical protein [Trifolium medium]